MAGQGASGAVAVLSATLFLAPALGVPHEEMLQDTLKSAVVSFGAIAAAALFFWSQSHRHGPAAMRWHAVLWLPAALLAYALGSMAWSHAYLGGVEAVRWCVFALIAWLGANTLSRDRLPLLAWGIHLGAVVASLWAALQFLFDFSFFPQGPHPASTFVNRNFFAEFAVATLPFGAMLLARSEKRVTAALLAASCGLVVVAILMTGTRAALMALWLQLLFVFPVAAYLLRRSLPFGVWPTATRLIAGAVFLAVVGGIGMMPTGDGKIAAEQRGSTAIERGLKRTGSVSARDESLGLRMRMWGDTLNMISHRPFSGVGAGAWENEIPLYQAQGSQLETDYYVHNEFLQLIAEYGLVGWAFLLALAAYLLDAARRTLRMPREHGTCDVAWRVTLLSSLLALMVVSNVGFAWRMAATGALFAVCLGALAASDARLASRPAFFDIHFGWTGSRSLAAMALTGGAFALAVFITHQAATAERDLVRAARLALTIVGSSDPASPRWDAAKAEMLQLTRNGVAITRHYRKITPIIADEAARWGDWANAVWIWESVLSSRPHVVAVLANTARAYMVLGQPLRALQYMQRAKDIQPGAAAVRSIEVLLLARSGEEAKALALGRQAIAEGVADYDMLNAVFTLARRSRDFRLAEQAMHLRLAQWPNDRTEGWFDLGSMFAQDAHEPDKAIAAFAKALADAEPAHREALMARVPPSLRAQVARGLLSKG
jgi:O-antigen ligase